jgi:hypothetical protein
MPFSSVIFLGGFLRLPFYYLPPQYTSIELMWYFINNIDTLFFLLTITFATLYTTGFGKKQLMYKLSVYCFVVSMIFLFITFLQMIVGLPYRF